MGSRKNRSSKRNSYRYSVDRKKLWKKAKKVPKIECTQLKQAWSEKKSIATNFAEMGLSHNANRTLKIRKTQHFIRPEEYEEQLQPKHKKPAATKSYVADQLAEEASLTKERVYTLSNQLQKFCTKMIDKYGEDYAAMAKDPRNYYQRTPKQIKGTIQLFKQVPGLMKHI
ncbi:nucleolar protein 16-like protein [Apostichopus japonicus]|uniref:Nucleolar protein 16 n=1 Tax=Stichopus japonicus TaxID=307972 RepID=A0A2G8JX74_STIJA|nr:nucleolar protein 16-like protein [Apostichopus japonicus]